MSMDSCGSKEACGLTFHVLAKNLVQPHPAFGDRLWLVLRFIFKQTYEHVQI